MKAAKRKWLAMGMAVAVLIAALTACGPSKNNSSSSPSSSPSTSASTEASNSPSASPESTESKEIKIGLVLAETGPASTLGLSEVQTQKLFQKQLDAQGPINGTKIKLVLQDYETDDTKAVIAVDRLLSEGVVAVVGATQVSTTAAILPKVVDAKLPFLTVAPANSKASDNVFVMTPSSSTVGSVVLEWLQKHNITKVAWINAKDAFGVEGKPAFEELIKGTDIQIVAHEEFDATATDMTVQLTKIKKAKPEVVIVWSRTPGAGVVARNFKTLGFDIPMIQSTAAANKGFLEQVKDDNKNIFVVGSKLSVADKLPDSDQKSRLIAFRDAFKAEFNAEPDLFAAHTNDALSMIVDAVKAGNTTSETISNYLRTSLGQYPGITGTFDFAESRGTAKADGLVVMGIENDAWTYNE
ncbi:ABC transporter substrate-binding protein [Cohnella sp. AR92]|uniref:ABC transporter substrate-binding protein n=1 Tax=Cohnella sp. AR92 TaxID=648716 RepID=UPI000F8E25D1|nr:ABC transporter substrate-binding protein [Cohnella sp. AR92]RUS45734.1 hypothetical protein ELR57_17890 [Cohnella sp. AR92]